MSAHLVQIGRIPVLLVLFVAIGPVHGEATDAVRRLDTGAYWAPWAQMVILGVLFVAIVLFDRRRRHSRAVLVAEAVVAAALVLPSFVWFRWLGEPSLNDVIRWTTFNEFSRALAIAWLVIAVATVVRQVRGESRVGAGDGSTPGSQAG